MTEDLFQIEMIVGLGNPGEEYRQTRHNAGFEAVDRILTKMPGKFEKSLSGEAEIWLGRFKGRRLVLVKPQTFMNLSGKAVAKACAKFEIAPEMVMLIYDDIALPLGKLRIRRNGGSGGHNGVESVISSMATNRFARIRIGIGESEPGRQIEHVLARFSDTEQTVAEKVLEAAAEAAMSVLRRGLNATMNEYNSYDAAAVGGNSEPAGN